MILWQTDDDDDDADEFGFNDASTHVICLKMVC